MMLTISMQKNNRIIDIHTHLLPGVDHGSNLYEQSQIYINKLLSLGINEVVLTSHFYTKKESFESFLDRYELAYKSFCEKFGNQINIIRGAEVAISRFFLRTKPDKRLNLGDSNCMLIELPLENKEPYWLKCQLENLISYGVKPVIAHIEKYKYAQKVRFVDKLVDLGCFIQVDNSSVLKSSKNRYIFELVKLGLVTCIASDMHYGSPIYWDKPLQILEKKCGKEAVDNLLEGSKKIINWK